MKKHVETYIGNSSKKAAECRRMFEEAQGRPAIIERVEAWAVLVEEQHG